MNDRKLLRVGERTALGALDRIRTVGALVHDGNARAFALSVVDVEALCGPSGRDTPMIDAMDLIDRIPIPVSATNGGYDRLPLVGTERPERALGESVQRSHPSASPIRGRMVAIRGAVSLVSRDSLRNIVVRGLLEVAFDTTSVDPAGAIRSPNPQLEPEDAGAIVATGDRRALGILVAGHGATGFAAPVDRYMEVHGLLLSPPRIRIGSLPERPMTHHLQDFDDGAYAQIGELGREPHLDLGPIPELA